MTTTEKANRIISLNYLNKKELAEELGITRPTLDTRLSGAVEWKKLETNWIGKLYKDFVG